MRVQQVTVLDLFGVFNHVIPMKMEERISIIHGPNGFGKTTILRLIDGVFNSRYSVIRSIPFSEFQVAFDDESILKVTKIVDRKHEELGPGNSGKLTFSLVKPGLEPEVFEPKRSQKQAELNFPVSAIDDFVPELERRGPRSWLNVITGETLTLDDVLENYGDVLPINVNVLKRRSEPAWFKSIKDCVEVRFIQTQRLLTLSSTPKTNTYPRSTPMKEVVIDYCKELAGAIQANWSEYGALSQSLDRTFPMRLVQGEVPTDLSIGDLRRQLSDLEEKRNRLTAAGLLDKEKDVDIQVPPTVDERTKGVLEVYVKDVQNKLSTFDMMAAKIDLFKKIINQRFKYKQMSISREQGITFATFDGFPLSPISLSSGEQHELVLLYDLIFRVEPNSFILIDEPEISLHIGWQEQFLKDLQQITELASFDVLIATHSPQIIYDRWDLTLELKGPAENGALSDSDKEDPSIPSM